MQSVLSEKEISWDLKSPCDDCPFKKNVPGHDGIAGSVSNYLETIDNHTFAHTCHKTDVREACDGPLRGKTYLNVKAQHCVGAIIMLVKSRKDLQIALLNALQSGKLSIDNFHQITKNRKGIHTVKSLTKFYLTYLNKKISHPQEIRICLKSSSI